MAKKKFIQLHLLTSYPPSNLNRDDLGRPKTAMFGGTQRLRVSSQSLKRAWRDSDAFEQAVGKGNKGVRTLRVAVEKVYEPLLKANVDEAKALKAAQTVRAAFETAGKGDSKEEGGPEKAGGKKKTDPVKALNTSQLVFVSPRQLDLIAKLVEAVKAGQVLDPDEVKRELLTNEGLGADVSLFGRMMSANQQFSVEAAAQVAHAITVHKVTVEDDYFSAVDDLNKAAEDAGAGHIGSNEFGAGLFYLYICIDRELLGENLRGDSALESRAIRGLIEAACTVSPTGKRASFASFARASYALAEAGDQQPRNLSAAFLRAVAGEDPLSGAIRVLKETRARMDAVYGQCADDTCEFDATQGTGRLADLLSFAAD